MIKGRRLIDWNGKMSDQTVRLNKDDIYTIVSIDQSTETCVLKLEKNEEIFFIRDFPLCELRKPTEQ